MSFVVIENLSKRFDALRVYEDVTLRIERGQVCVLVGPSGCGKTTLLRSIAGLLTPDSGRILVDKSDVTALPAKDRGISMVFQQYALFPNMTVWQNLSFGLRQQGKSRAEVTSKVAVMLDLVGLSSHAQARPATLSGGQKQRVALARALVLEPKLLLLDEPMSALDAQIRKRLREEIKRLQKEVGFTAILVTHDQDDALTMGDQIAVMKNGRFEQVGTPIEIYNHPKNRAVATFIGDLNVIDPRIIRRIFGKTSSCSWAIHPEAIELGGASREPTAEYLSVAGEVSTVRMMGSVIRYAVDVAGTSLQANVLNNPSARPYKVGDKICISIATQNVRKVAE